MLLGSWAQRVWIRMPQVKVDTKMRVNCLPGSFQGERAVLEGSIKPLMLPGKLLS